MKILKSPPFFLAILLYGISLFQCATGLSLFLGDFVVGIFPNFYIYFSWLFLVATNLGFARERDTKVAIGIILFTMLFTLPAYWMLINFLFGDNQRMLVFGPILSLVGLILLISVIIIWRIMARTIFCRVTNTQYGSVAISFSDYQRVFWYFAGAFVTIWWLQPLIISSIQKGKSAKNTD